MFDFVSFFPRAVMQGIPLLYGSTGEILTEKSGNLNLGIPGVMYVGGICGVIGAFFYEQGGNVQPFLAVLIPLVCCLLGSLLMGLLYCFLTVTLRANQNVTGLAMTTFGVGFGNFFGGSLIKLTGAEVPSIALSATSACFRKTLPIAETTGVFGKLFLSYGFLAYAAVVIALIASYVLKKTRVGLQLRAVGESPATADAAGINIARYKYKATCIGAMIAGLGGLYYVQRCLRRPGLAGHRSGDLHHLAAQRGHPQFHSLRWAVHPVPVHSNRGQPGGEGAVQDAALHRNHHCAGADLHAQQAGKPAPRKPGRALLPGRAVKRPFI